MRRIWRMLEQLRTALEGCARVDLVGVARPGEAERLDALTLISCGTPIGLLPFHPPDPSHPLSRSVLVAMSGDTMLRRFVLVAMPSETTLGRSVRVARTGATQRYRGP